MEKKRSVRIERSPFHIGCKYYVTIDKALYPTGSGNFLGLGTKEEAKKEAKSIRKMLKMGISLDDILTMY